MTKPLRPALSVSLTPHDESSLTTRTIAPPQHTARPDSEDVIEETLSTISHRSDRIRDFAESQR